jgi:hypothetical protein
LQDDPVWPEDMLKVDDEDIGSDVATIRPWVSLARVFAHFRSTFSGVRLLKTITPPVSPEQLAKLGNERALGVVNAELIDIYGPSKALALSHGGDLTLNVIVGTVI